MGMYKLKSRKNTEIKNPKVARAQKVRTMLLLKFAVRDSNKSKFIKQQETRRFLSSLHKTPLSRIPLVGNIKANEIFNKLLLAGDKFMSGMQ